MGNKSQRKGRRAEFELAAALNEKGYQARASNPLNYGTEPDVIGLPGIHIECKRAERLRLSEWMEQAERDAERFEDGLPAVFHRGNREEWRVTMRLSDWLLVYYYFGSIAKRKIDEAHKTAVLIERLKAFRTQNPQQLADELPPVDSD